MKKTVLTLAMGALLASGAAQADFVGGIYVGAQYWDMASDGVLKGDNASTSFDLGDGGKGSVWVALEHPIPLLPNLKVRYNQLDGEGSATLNGDINIDGNIFAASSNMALDAELNHADLVLYYELLDNALVSLDVGVNVKVGDFKISATGFDANGAAISYEGKHSGPVPMLYASGIVGLPLTGLSAFAEVSGLAYSGNQAYDAQIGIGYDIIDNLLIDLTAQVGYRAFKLKSDDFDDIDADIDFDGAFVGLVAHF
jgi:outer membrane protein